ncbi:COX15/CtaA family protein [Halorientalis persicus]|uniref:COX15/CtaA family protein n=1 Tax=Halorientalis persicus TaxID=1367881 RepID=UPI000B89BDF3|nr:COX15/CtaA family protein [Halorientalis persicus]
MKQAQLFSSSRRAIVRGISYHQLALTTLIGTYLLMILGAYTSAIGAGLACPDWPACYGTLVPFLHPEIIASSPYSGLQIFAEWAHRTLAVIIGLLIISTAFTAWYTRDSALVRGPAVFAALLLPFQVILGGLTVTASLAPIVVTSHLATATLILIALTATTVASWPSIVITH